MCGIAGFIDLKGRVSAEQLELASRAIVHRGPDDDGAEVVCMKDGVGSVGLANRRLSILDLSSGGHQPMHDFTTGNVIAYNGEIYNFQELRHELACQGAEFASHTDTEVVLKAYAAWGEGCLERFRGMFAFVIWDATQQRLFMARDRLGKKPFYYYEAEGMLLFASEVRALLATGIVPRQINERAVQQFLTFGSMHDPETLVEGVRALPAAHCMIWQQGRCEIREYWKLEGNQHEPQKSEEAIVPELHLLLYEAIHLRTVSDVPLGVFLSGGIDSSAIVAVLSSNTQQKVNTFSIVFKDEEYNEARFSRHLAQRFHTEHHEIELTGDDFLAAVPDAMCAMDQPSIDGFNTYVISREVRRTGLKVALSGLGADEIFAGYGTFRSIPRMETFMAWSGFLPGALRRAVSSGLMAWSASDQKRKLAALVAGNGSVVHPYVLARSLFTPTQSNQLLNGSCPSRKLQESFSSMAAKTQLLDAVNRVAYLELKSYTANTLLRDTDCMSMANGLEVRVPFLDHQLVEYALSIPGKLKVDPHTPKHLLVKAMQGLLPEEIVHRPKRGFTLPFEHWLRDQLKADVEGVLTSNGDGPLSTYFQPKAVKGVWQDFLEGKTSWSRPWSLYVLDRWCNKNL